MEDERKEYSVVGQVTIGTDEYRDLIESIKDAEAREKELSTRSSDNYWARMKAENEVKELKQYKEYVTEKCLDGFKLWKLEKECDED